MIERGETAPGFELPDQDGDPVRLSDLRGAPVVLGASPQPVAAVKRFHDKQGFNFRLLADEDHSVADGKPHRGAQRTTFVIDAEGRVADVIPKLSPKTHEEQVLKILGSS